MYMMHFNTVLQKGFSRCKSEGAYQVVWLFWLAIGKGIWCVKKPLVLFLGEQI